MSVYISASVYGVLKNNQSTESRFFFAIDSFSYTNILSLLNETIWVEEVPLYQISNETLMRKLTTETIDLPPFSIFVTVFLSACVIAIVLRKPNLAMVLNLLGYGLNRHFNKFGVLSNLLILLFWLSFLQLVRIIFFADFMCQSSSYRPFASGVYCTSPCADAQLDLSDHCNCLGTKFPPFLDSHQNHVPLDKTKTFEYRFIFTGGIAEGHLKRLRKTAMITVMREQQLFVPYFTNFLIVGLKIHREAREQLKEFKLRMLRERVMAKMWRDPPGALGAANTLFPFETTAEPGRRGPAGFQSGSAYNTSPDLVPHFAPCGGNDPSRFASFGGSSAALSTNSPAFIKSVSHKYLQMSTQFLYQLLVPFSVIVFVSVFTLLFEMFFHHPSLRAFFSNH